MDSIKVKTIAYVLTITAVVMLFGLALVKLTSSAPTPSQTKEQQLQALENSKSVTSPQAKGFIQNAETRTDAAREAEAAAGE